MSHFDIKADVLVATTERPAKDALAQLTAAELKKLGISVTDGGDAVFIKPADSAVDSGSVTCSCPTTSANVAGRYLR